MDEEISNTEKTSPLSFVPALGLLGLCIAVVAVALGIFSMVKVSDTSAEMNDKIEKAAALSIDMKKISDRIDSLALQLEDAKSGDNAKVNDLAKQTQKAVESIGKILNENRAAIEENRKAMPFHCGTVQYPIKVMEEEHGNEGLRFERIAALTGNFSVPEDACPSYRLAMQQLRQFKDALHEHIHLENNIIFPKALAMERTA